MPSRKLLTWLAAAAFIASAPAAFAVTDTTPTQIDHRVRTVMYQPDQVYKFTGHYGFESSIEFAPDEAIQAISMGDSTAWVLQPATNRIFLKPVEQGATTNMTVLTNQRTYLFEMHAKEAADINDPDMTFIFRFNYPMADTGGNLIKHYNEDVSLPDIENEPFKYNFKYSISGPEVTAPIRIFDDGEFTFFQFRNKNADLPAFFMVDSEGNESMINYRTRGDYIVVERVAERFTLRHGADINCVFNDGFPRQFRMKPQQVPKNSGG